VIITVTWIAATTSTSSNIFPRVFTNDSKLVAKLDVNNDNFLKYSHRLRDLSFAFFFRKAAKSAPVMDLYGFAAFAITLCLGLSFFAFAVLIPRCGNFLIICLQLNRSHLRLVWFCLIRQLRIAVRVRLGIAPSEQFSSLW